MTPKKIPTNDLDRALMALVKSKSALPRFLRARLNKERRYPIAWTMRGPWESVLPRTMGFPWASADGFRRSLGRMP
jgi:hypothetical protein